jgi:hypothetical protein
MAARKGQSTIEFVISYGLVLLPASLAVIFTAQLLWVWHSANEFSRQGASYATTHCWQGSSANVLDFMRSNVPPMINRDQFQNGPVQINVTYYARDPESGQLAPFQCDGDCTSGCIPDLVTVSVTGYEFRSFLASLGLPPVAMPDFRTSLPMESAGCDPEQGVCLP